MFDVITIGSATLDVFFKSSSFQLVEKDGTIALCEKFNEKIDVEEAAVSTGGAATNTAVGFARQGFRVACIAEIGDDLAGRAVLEELRTEGVSTTFMVQEPEEQTALASLLISQDGGRTALVHRGASKMLTIKDIPWDKLQTKWIHLSSVGNAELVTETLRFCHEHNIGLSWNPGNWEIEAISQAKLHPDWSAVHILFVNREEMAKLSGVDLSQDHLWKDGFCFRGPRVTVITDGKNGGQYCVDGRANFYQIEHVRSVQETGAGDAFACGVVSATLRHETIAQAVQLGLKNAASVVQQMGAKKGLLKSA